jgi:hypothetical protein
VKVKGAKIRIEISIKMLVKFEKFPNKVDSWPNWWHWREENGQRNLYGSIKRQGRDQKKRFGQKEEI